MLDDNPYIRMGPGQPRWTATAILLIVNVSCFILQVLAYRFSHFPVNKYFALSTDGLLHGYIWQLLTFQFMHGGTPDLLLGILHLSLNSVAIYCFGRALEETLGSSRLVKLYFSTGIFGGIFQIVGSILMPTHFGSALVGASAGAFGLIAAFATLFPDRSLTMLLFFIIPIRMKAEHLLLLSAVIAIYGMMFPGDLVAHAAHLGGMLAGVAYIRWFIFPQLRAAVGDDEFKGEARNVW